MEDKDIRKALNKHSADIKNINTKLFYYNLLVVMLSIIVCVFIFITIMLLTCKNTGAILG